MGLDVHKITYKIAEKGKHTDYLVSDVPHEGAREELSFDKDYVKSKTWGIVEVADFNRTDPTVLLDDGNTVHLDPLKGKKIWCLYIEVLDDDVDYLRKPWTVGFYGREHEFNDDYCRLMNSGWGDSRYAEVWFTHEHNDIFEQLADTDELKAMLPIEKGEMIQVDW